MCCNSWHGWLQALPSWGGLDLVEAGSSSSLSSVTSETPVPAVRATSTGLAELATLGSSPDTWPQPVISGRRGSDVFSWSTTLDAALHGAAPVVHICRALWERHQNFDGIVSLTAIRMAPAAWEECQDRPCWTAVRDAAQCTRGAPECNKAQLAFSWCVEEACHRDGNS